MSSKSISNSPAWKALKQHKEELHDTHMRDLFAQDDGRADKFYLELDGLFLDYSKHRITDKTQELLLALAKEREIETKREEMFSGSIVNFSENRAALHSALRGSTAKDIDLCSENISDFVASTLDKIKNLSNKIRSEGHYTDIVNIGVGGSDIGARMVCTALAPFFDGPRIHFVSNIDGAAILEILATLDLSKTLFIVASKTFTTLETLSNAQTARQMVMERCGSQAVQENFIAITAEDKTAMEFGISPENILPLRDWIGGRFSLWSALAMPIAIGGGFETLKSLLDGAHAMDEHFCNAPLKRNMPVTLALLGVWYRNFWGFSAYAIAPYAHHLKVFPEFLKQIDMESNGKSVTLDGAPVDYDTGPLVIGGIGTDCQHAFFQLLHQGTDITPVDFIVIKTPEHKRRDLHEKLTMSALAQSQALMQGQENKDEPHRNFKGNRPSSTLILERLDPYHLGMLIALYEHKIFVQGALWGINSFDQWGVELGKTLAKKLFQHDERSQNYEDLDSSTAMLLKQLFT